MNRHETRCIFSVVVIVWWEWFEATIIDVGPAEFIAVENRSHKFLQQLSDYNKASSLIKPAASEASGWADFQI